MRTFQDWDDAKRGVISRRKFAKLHILVTRNGTMVSCRVTEGQVSDIVMLAKLMKDVPDGDGYVILDAGYFSHANCEIIADSGRMPVICPKKNYRKKGYCARTDMLNRYESNPEQFEKIYHQRSMVEAVFSSIKTRISPMVRQTSMRGIRTGLMLRCICYNLTV